MGLDRKSTGNAADEGGSNRMLISQTVLLLGRGSNSSVIPPAAILPIRLPRSFHTSEVLSSTVKLRGVLPPAARSDSTIKRRGGRPLSSNGSSVTYRTKGPRNSSPEWPSGADSSPSGRAS